MEANLLLGYVAYKPKHDEVFCRHRELLVCVSESILGIALKVNYLEEKYSHLRVGLESFMKHHRINFIKEIKY